MASLTGPISLYNLCSASVFQEKRYKPNTAMAYIYKMSPLYAFIIQKCGAEEWFQSADFNCTCFIPNREYSARYLRYFIDHLDYETARNILAASLIRGRVNERLLSSKEGIPAFGKLYSIFITGDHVNGLRIENKFNASNGTIYTLNGVIRPMC